MPRNLHPPMSISLPASASAAANGLVTRTLPSPPMGALISRATSLKTPRTTINSSPLNGGMGRLVAIAIMVVIFLTFCACATFYWRRRKRSRLQPQGLGARSKAGRAVDIGGRRVQGTLIGISLCAISGGNSRPLCLPSSCLHDASSAQPFQPWIFSSFAIGTFSSAKSSSYGHRGSSFSFLA
ncbi:hypothetical protein NL676_039540 [Syzygium grande]|nr:hypothetical protein NL676_039540 [Syzygium grande]